MNENFNLRLLLKEKEIKLYLFGSARYKDMPKDIDILMVYPNKNVSINYAIEIKNSLLNYLSNGCNLSIDWLLLSLEEEAEVNFIDKEKAILIKLS